MTHTQSHTLQQQPLTHIHMTGLREVENKSTSTTSTSFPTSSFVHVLTHMLITIRGNVSSMREAATFFSMTVKIYRHTVCRGTCRVHRNVWISEALIPNKTEALMSYEKNKLWAWTTVGRWQDTGMWQNLIFQLRLSTNLKKVHSRVSRRINERSIHDKNSLQQYNIQFKKTSNADNLIQA